MTDTSIDVPLNERCAFCDYLAGSRPFSFVFRDGDTALLVTREQRGHPHVLAIPERHVETLLELTDDEASKLALLVRNAAQAIEQEFKPSGLSVWQNNGEPASQSIAHVHFHVAGTVAEGGTRWGEVPELSISKTEAIADKLRPYFR